MELKKTDLTDAEWQVMECLWDNSPLTGQEVTALLQEQTGWSRSTTLTLLGRLVAKGAVREDRGNGKKRFEPVLRMEDAQLAETENFLNRVYKGSVSLMISAMTQNQALDIEEVEELYRILRGDGAQS